MQHVCLRDFGRPDFNENTAHDNAENMHKSVNVQLICAF